MDQFIAGVFQDSQSIRPCYRHFYKTEEGQTLLKKKKEKKATFSPLNDQRVEPKAYSKLEKRNRERN